jgi:transposase
MNGNKERPKATAGVDLGDKYSYLCLLDTESGEVIEVGLLCAPTGLLGQVEGIGPLTALTFVLTLENPYRLEKSRSVGAYLGVVPATDQWGERDPREKRIFRRRATRCLA